MEVPVDGQRRVSASSDGSLRIWDIKTGTCLHILEGHSGQVTSVSAIVDGRWRVSPFSDGSLRIWDMETGQGLKTLQPLPGLTLFGVNLSTASIMPPDDPGLVGLAVKVDLSAAPITPPAFAEVLRQNGARVSSDPNASAVK